MMGFTSRIEAGASQFASHVPRNELLLDISQEG